MTGTTSAQKSFKKQAELLFKKENYHEALKSLNAYPKCSEDLDALYMRAVAYYYTGQAEQCISDMVKLHNELYDKNDILLYLAKSFQDLGMFAEATDSYKKYLNLINDEKQQRYIINEIKKCEYSGLIQFLPQIAYIENLSEAVNTKYDEVSPLQSLNLQNKFYFSSNREGNVGGQKNIFGHADELGGKYNFDMFAVELNDGNYTPILNFNEEQNTSNNEVIQDFSRDGSIVYYLRYTTPDNMRMLADTFTKIGLAQNPENKIELPVDFKAGDKDFRLFNDSIMVFSSKRTGGFGGYDIYFAKKTNNSWNQIINAGPSINSTFDEINPFLTKGGNSLIFSSNDLFGLGGHDIFASKYDEDKKAWSEKINLGLPINSPKDDIGSYVTHDGSQLLFSSNRIGGIGGYDLYIAYLKEQLHDQLSYTEDLPIFTNTVDSAFIANDQRIEKSPVLKSNVNKTVVINTPLYYFNDESVLSSNNKIILKNIKSILDINPLVKVHLIAHSDFDPAFHQSLFFNCKRAETVVDYLVNMGIKSNRFTVHSYGSSFPMVNDKNNRNNSRIEILFEDIDKNQIEINDDLPILNIDAINPSYQDYLLGKKALAYKVRIAKAKQMMKNDVFLSYPYFSVMKNKDNEYEYYCGYKTTYEEAKQLKLSLLSKGFTEAAIVPFVNHTALNVETAKSQISVYSDLKNYIELEK